VRITAFQAQLMFQVLFDSCRIAAPIGGLEADQRLKLSNQILNQQSGEVVDLGTPNESFGGTDE